MIGQIQLKFLILQCGSGVRCPGLLSLLIQTHTLTKEHFLPRGRSGKQQICMTQGMKLLSIYLRIK